MNWYQKVKEQMSDDEVGILIQLLGKIIGGKRDWDLDELQLQSNHPQTIEEILQDMVKQDEYDLTNLHAAVHNWYRYAKNLLDMLQELGVSEEIVQFVQNAPPATKGLMINELKKNPALTIADLGQIQPKEKMDPYLPREHQSVERYGLPPELAKWYLVQCRKLRQGKSLEDLALNDNLMVKYMGFTQDFDTKSQEVMDWFNDVRPTATDLANMTWSEMINEVNEWHERMAGRGTGVEYGPTKPELILYGPQWKNPEWQGWTIQELKTENDLDAEGNKMNHCVGSYYDSVQGGNLRIISLRDPSNKPHVTMEVDPMIEAFYQIQGNSNSEPDKEYKAMIKEWVQSMGGIRSHDSESEDSPYNLIHGAYADIESMGEGLEEWFSPDDYGLSDSNLGDPDFEDLINMFVERQKKESWRARNSDYYGDITEIPRQLIELATEYGQRLGNVNWGLSALEDDLEKVEQETWEEFYNNWWSEPLESPPDEDDFKTQEEYERAYEEWEKQEQEYESEAIDKTRRQWTQYALPDNTFKELNELRKKGKYTYVPKEERMPKSEVEEVEEVEEEMVVALNLRKFLRQ